MESALFFCVPFPFIRKIRGEKETIMLCLLSKDKLVSETRVPAAFLWLLFIRLRCTRAALCSCSCSRNLIYHWAHCEMCPVRAEGCSACTLLWWKPSFLLLLCFSVGFQNLGWKLVLECGSWGSGRACPGERGEVVVVM